MQGIVSQAKTTWSGEEALLIQSSSSSRFSNHLVESASVYSRQPQAMQPPIPISLWQRIAQIAATNPKSDLLLLEVTTALGEEFSAEGCVISICQPPQPCRQVGVWFSQKIPVLEEKFLATYPLLEAMVLQAEDALIIPDIQVTEVALEEQNLPVCSVLGVKTQYQGQVNGVITVMRSQSYAWADSEVDHLIAVSNQVSATISQVLLQQQVQRQAQYQTLVRQLTIAIRNAMDLPQILKLAVDGASQALQVDQGAVFRVKYWDPRHNLRSTDHIPRVRVLAECEWRNPDLPAMVELPAVTPNPDTSLTNSFWVADCALCRRMFVNSSEPLVLNDQTDFPELMEGVKVAPMFDPVVMPALLLVPLESKNKILGFLALQQSQPRIWQSEEIELAELVAAQLSSAIIQTETLRQVESLVEERTAQLQQSLELQAKLYDITRKQIEKLREMNQRMDEFLSTLSHELRTPLTSMMLAIRMLREADLSPDRRIRYLNILEQQCAQETNLVNDLLALQELETKQVLMQAQQVDLTHIILERVQCFNQQWLSKGLTLEVNLPDRAIMLKTDCTSLNRILLELLTNAGKYSDSNTIVRIEVVYQPGQQVVISIANQGVGIAAEELPHIFDKFRRCQGMTQNAVPGTGLGLALVKSLVQHLNGTVEAASEPIADSQSYQTCFTVTLPQTLDMGKLETMEF